MCCICGHFQILKLNLTTYVGEKRILFTASGGEAAQRGRLCSYRAVILSCLCACV